MKLGLLIIGNEILNGKISDVNTRFLAEFLKRHHHELSLALTVKDTEPSIHLGLKTLFSECDAIVTSGGLGPTLDDITKQTIASFIGRKISFSPIALEVAKKNYARFDREFAGETHGYCQLPDGFFPLDNPAGFAPGLFSDFNGKKIFCAPGVPREFKALIEDQLLGLVEDPTLKKGHILQLYFRTKRIPEEKIFGEVDKDLWQKLEQFGDVSSLPNYAGVDIGVSLRSEDEKTLLDKKDSVVAVMRASPVWPSVWHQGTESAEEIIVSRATDLKKTFAFAESCTGGLCSHRITNVSGASRCFWGSVVSYDNSVKEKTLKVSSETLQHFGAVSIEAAKELATGVRKVLNVDIGISISGIAGPGGGFAEKPVGTVCVGWSTKDETDAVRLQFFGDRELLKNRFAQTALFTLLERLEKIADA